MANKVTIDVEARFVDNVTGKTKSASRSVDEIGKSADKAQKKLDGLGKKNSRPKLDADDSRLIKKLRAAETKADRLGRKKTKVVLGAVDKATSVINKVFNKGKSIAGKVWKATVAVKDSNALATIQKITNGGGNIAGKTWRAAVKIKDYATAPLSKIKNMLFSIKTLVLAITAGLAANQFVMKPISLADAYSSAQIGFSTLLGESRGQQMMNDLDAFAKATPFKTSEVIANTQKMIAMGWAADDIIKDMTTIGDAAAATGKGDEGLNRIVLALAQIKTKGKLSTEELNQLAEAGISAKKYLAEGLGYGSGDAGMMKLSKDLEQGAIGADAALKAIMQGMQEYKGMMDKTANETAKGLWSQIEDTFEINVARRWGQGLQDGAKKGLGSIVTLLDTADGALIKFGDTLYDVGSAFSNWSAEKLANAVKRITEVTDSFEFKNASLGEKISMLWKGVVSDPLKEWWEGGGQQKTAATAGKIGSWLGKTLSSMLKGALGMTDVLKGEGIETGAAGIAQSFAKGFVDNFDVSGITEKLKEAISNVWNALPTWGKLLVGGYAGGKIASGLGGIIGGIGNIVGTGGKIGKGILNFGANTAINLGAGNLAGTASLGTGALSALGLGAVAGGATAAFGVGHVIKSGYQAYQGYKEGDETKRRANSSRAVLTGAGIAGGALLGAKAGAMVGAVGGPVGSLIGAGLGTAIGWFAGDKIARNIEAAKYESEGMKEAIKDSDVSAEELAKTFEKSVYENMKKNMGDIKLSMSEIERLADQVVWGDDLGNFDKFTQATKNAEANLKSLKTAAADTDKWMWKASLGVKFNEDEIESIKTSFDDYISSAKSYVENKHYEFTAAVSMLVDVKSEEGKGILKSGDAFFKKMQDQLNSLGDKLSKKVDIALKDGVITLDEQAEITNLQQQIAEITNKLASSESSAKMDLIKLKFGSGTLDLDSYENFMDQMQTTIDERMQASDDAFVASVSKLKLQLSEGAISQEEYDKQVKALVSGYKATVDELRAEVQDVELDIIAKSNYGDMLGDDAKTKLSNALSKALSDGVDPIEWSPEQVRKILGVDSLSSEAAGAIGEMLSGVYGHMKLLEVDGKLMMGWEVENKEDPEQKIKDSLPETVEETVGVDISGEKHIQDTIDILASDFGIPPEHAATVALLLTGHKKLLNKIDVSQLAKEFGIPESQAKTIIEKLTGAKSIENRLSVLASDFGIPKSISETISVNITAIKGKITNAIGNVKKAFGIGGNYRGGIVGGSSSMGSFARGGIAGYSDGGMVRGGSQLIEVAEEGSPEMIIPLSSQRRGRALKLWAQAGNIMGVPGFARGGLTNGGQDEGIRFNPYDSGDSSGGQSVVVEVGGVSVEIHVDATGGQSVAEAIKEQSGEIAETVAGILADAFGAQFENTPTKGGVA